MKDSNFEIAVDVCAIIREWGIDGGKSNSEILRSIKWSSVGLYAPIDNNVAAYNLIGETSLDGSGIGIMVRNGKMIRMDSDYDIENPWCGYIEDKYRDIFNK